MKAARLKGELLTRKGAAQPVLGADGCHGDPAAGPQLAAVERGSAKQKLSANDKRGTAERPRGNRAPDLKRDKFGRVRVSLRLDPHRHLRLKLLSAHSRMSLQETLIAALDAYLGDEVQSVNSGNCDCLQDSSEMPQDEHRPEAAGIESAE